MKKTNDGVARRRFLRTIPAAVAVGIGAPAIARHALQQQEPRITTETLDCAEKVFGIDFSQAEEEQAVTLSHQGYLKRLPLNTYRALPRFTWYTLAIVRQLEHSDGLIGYSLLAEPMKKTFWTLSAWQDPAALHRFTRAMPHQQIMRSLHPYLDPTRFTNWEVPGSALPIPWPKAIAMLQRSSPRRGSHGPPQRH